MLRMNSKILLPALLVSLFVVFPVHAGFFDSLKEKLQASIDETIQETEDAIKDKVEQTETSIKESVQETEDAIVESVDNTIDETLNGKQEKEASNNAESSSGGREVATTTR